MTQADRVVRVFISSTFRDMFRERDILVKRIFPQLRKLCEARFVTWGEVDLRWGVPDEKKAEGKVLPICLEEIKRCRPYFIGILGERYGSLPEELPQDLLAREPWLKEHLKHSLTELEIWHGVLNDPKMAGRAFFYLRDPGFLDCLPNEANRADFASENPEAAEKLAKLKARIRASGLPVRENYAAPEKFGDLVLEDLTKVINELYPPGSEPDPLDREALLHEAFARSRAQVYIGRDEYFKRLDEHASGGGPPLVILGESGSGKSALLANWAQRFRKDDPDDLLILHFIGASPQSSDWAAMLRRIMGEFKRKLGFTDEIPDKPDALRSAFANWLYMASARGRVVLILDALNQLEDRDGAPDLVWLPPVIPANIRLVLSTLPGRPFDDLKKRSWPALAIQPFTTDERARFTRDYLAQYRKELGPAQAAHIAAAKQAENPLFLQALLEELRLFGKYEELEKRINLYLAAPDIPSLYEFILARYEEDYEDDRPGLVKDAMSAIWAARRGLSEVELLDILGKDGAPLPRAYWSRLFLAAEQALVSKAGLLNFFHDHLRTAVRNRYLREESQQAAAHLRLADYFEKQRLDPRGTDELPWQLVEGKSWQHLYDLLSDLDFFEQAWNVNRFDLKAYWAQVEAGSKLRMTAAYRPVLVAPDRVPNVNRVWQLGILLADTGHPAEAFSLRAFLTDHFRETGDRNNYQASLGGQALILAARGDLDGAMKLHQESERICRDLGNKDSLQASLCNQAVILYARGDLDGAMKLHNEVERICRELGNKDGLMRSLGNQASILYSRGDLDGAMKLYKEQERICRELGNKDGLHASLGNQALILKDRGDLDGAMMLHKEEERICRELGNKDGLQASLGNQANILYSRGDLDGAMKLNKEEERIFRELGNKSSLSAALGNQASILYARGDLDGAMKLHKEQEHICRELGNKNGLHVSLGSQALILKDRGDLDGAMKLHKEEERICRELGNKDGLWASLGNQANILYSRGDLDGAMKLHNEVERICRELGHKDGLQTSLDNQAVILYSRGDFDGAMELHKEQERICRELENKYGLQRSLAGQANILYVRAHILRARGDLDGAMKLFKEQERICRELRKPDGIATSLIDQALLLAEGQNRPREALPLAEEAYRLVTEHGFVPLEQHVRLILDSIRAKLGKG